MRIESSDLAGVKDSRILPLTRFRAFRLRPSSMPALRNASAAAFPTPWNVSA
jgi:hypothetical protein